MVTFFQGSNKIEVVGETSNGDEAIEMTRALIPDVVIMDIELPCMNGIEAARTIHAEFPNVRIIGLSIHDEPEKHEGMLQAGAVCSLSKNRSWDIIIVTIVEALEPGMEEPRNNM
jgi:DNA-binding NarL/FixJ family response regulator